MRLSPPSHCAGQTPVPLWGAGVPVIPPPSRLQLPAGRGLRSAMPVQFLLSSADGQILPHIHNIYIKKAT